MAHIEALFAEADTNKDGTLTENEFRNFINRRSVPNIDIKNHSFVGNGGNGGSSFGYSTSNDFAYSGGGGGGYDSSSYDTSSGAAAYRASRANVAGNMVAGGGDAATLANYTLGSSSASSTNVQQYETDAQGLFKDNNPEIVRRPAPDGPVTYAQNIKVRFMQPPPVPPPGPLIIKEVRPPQPPPPPPLVVRQRAPPLPQPPPLILRERPPPTPAAVASQTVIRNLAAIPMPPRSVIIERLPAAPPKPRDIIIERWIPYGAAAKRRTIVQRAEAAKEYPRPRNVIIQYEVPQVRVIRQFQRLAVTPENPQEYIQRYGATLFDTTTLLQQARAAGVVEDISPPIVSGLVATGGSEFSSLAATGGGQGAGRASFYNSSSYSSSGDASGLAAQFNGNINISTERTADDVFNTLDTNHDGVLSMAEFHNAALQ